MDAAAETRLAEFTRFLDEEQERFAEAMRTGDTTAVEANQIHGFTVYFGHAGKDPAEVIDRATCNAGMRASVAEAARAGLTKRFEGRIVRMVGPDEAAVSFEQVLEAAGRVVARLLTLERWRHIDGAWRIVREFVEPAGI